MKRNVILFAAVGALGILAAQGSRAEVDKKTERTWKAKCASCHGADGKGDTDQGKKLGVKDYTTAEWQTAKTDAQIKAGIENGVPDKMDGYKGKIDDAQVGKLCEFVRGLKK